MASQYKFRIKRNGSGSFLKGNDEGRAAFETGVRARAGRGIPGNIISRNEPITSSDPILGPGRARITNVPDGREGV
jgi:hypothetical protein